MALLTEMVLPEIDIFDPEFAKDPHGVYRRAREQGAWAAKYQFGYLLLDYESVRHFLRADDICRTPNRDITQLWNAHGTNFARFNDNNLMALGGEAHDRLRRLVAPAFTPRVANNHRSLMQATIRQVLEPVISTGACDFVEVATGYPITVICRLVGIPPGDVHIFRDWVDGLDAAFGQDASVLPKLDRITGQMFDYIDGVLATRRASAEKPDDLLQTLLDLAESAEGLNEEELRCLLIILLGGGFDTTRNQMVLTMFLMIKHPEYWRRLADDPSFVKPLIEESIRYYNPIGTTHRVTNVEHEYRGVTMPPNTFISIPQAAPGRDPTVNADPERFDPDRRNPTHLAFGQGAHMCLGMFIARALLEESLPVLARSMKEPKLVGDPTFRSPMAIWGLDTLPITFAPGEL
jgi:cytochrome P450